MTWSPEIALLLEATSPHSDENAISRIHRQIARGVDWSELLRIAIPHGVMPLLSRNLSTFAASVIPGPTLVQLQLFGKKVTERNQEQSVELVKIISALTREGIRVLPFKGPALAIAAYGDIGLRESHDLDLWVDPMQVARANEWFREAGYRPVKHIQGVAREVSDFGEGQGEFLSPDGRVLIELRDHLERSDTSDFDPAFDPIWSRRTHASLEVFEIPVFGIEDLIPSLAVHGSKHRWRRLNWVTDIAALVFAHQRIDWEVMLTRATEWRCRRPLLTAVTLASKLYGVELPQPCKRAGGLAVGSAVLYVSSTLFRPEGHTVGSVCGDILYRLQSYDSTAGRLRLVRSWLGRLLKADEERGAVRLSKNLNRVYRGVARVRGWVARVKLPPAEETRRGRESGR